MLLVETRQQSWKQVSARDSRGCERERPDLCLGSAGERAPCIGQERLSSKNVLGKHLARRRQARTAPFTLDQLRAELLFERSDVLGYRRLADVEPLGRA
jgi:hypothetical protein